MTTITKRLVSNVMAANNASATFGLSITEKWIRERLKLQKESLGIQ